MSDSIFITGLLIHAHHGVMPHEETVGQRFVIDLEMAVDLAPAGGSDNKTSFMGNVGAGIVWPFSSWGRLVADARYRDHFSSGPPGEDRVVAAEAVACLHLVKPA